MTILNRIASNWSFQEREKLNNNWSIIEGYLSNLQGQINILTGDVNVQDLVDQINDILNQGNVVIADLEEALKDATTVITNTQNATIDANNAAQEALNAINDMQAFINQFGNAESYDNTKLYKVNNIVEFDGSGFICIKDTQGNPPPTLSTKRNEWWQLFAQKGTDGTGAVSKVAGKYPEVDGNVPLTAQDVGAASSTDLNELKQIVNEHLADLTLNVKNYGAVGDGKVDDTQAFIDALADLKVIRDTYRLINNFQSNTGGNITLYVPHGTYKISNQLNIPKGTCIRGEKHCSVIFANISFTMFSILNDIPERIENGALLDEDIYTSIENVSLFGCKYGTNPFAVHSVDNASNGIVVDTHRFKITDCDIVGFPGKGIVVNSKYYGTIRDCKITHCGVGIFLDGGISKEVTAIKITRNEIRLNGQGIRLNRGFGNTVIDNTIESNMANYLPSETEQPISYLSKGKALSLVNSHENIIRDNYIENHYTNILFYNAYNNQVNSNFLVAGALEGQQNQILFDGATNNNNLFYFNEMHSASGTNGLSSLITIYNYNSVEGSVFYTFNLDAILTQNNIWNSGFIGIETKSPTIIEPKSNRVYRNKTVKMFTLS